MDVQIVRDESLLVRGRPYGSAVGLVGAVDSTVFAGHDRYEAPNCPLMAGSIVKSTKKAWKFQGAAF